MWSQWACHMSIRLLRNYGGRWLAWLVSPWLRLGETTRQQARKLHTGWLRSAWSDCWGPSTHGYSNHALVVARWVITEGATRHHHRVAVSRCIQHYQRPTPFSLTPSGLAALHVRLLSEIHSTQAWLFISLVLHGQWDLDLRTVHICKNQRIWVRIWPQTAHHRQFSVAATALTRAAGRPTTSHLS